MTRNLRALLLLTPLFATTLRASIQFNITPEHCSYADGYIGVTVTGGVPPYTYSWSDGPTTQNRYDLVAASYTLTVTDFVGAQQQNTAVVPNLAYWPWDPVNMFAQAIPSCLQEPEPNQWGLVFFGGDVIPAPMGPAPHQFDQSCEEQPFTQGSYPADWAWFAGQFSITRAKCSWALPGETYAVNYTDANGCPGYMEAVVPQVPQFYPVTILDIEGSCSGGANGSARFSIPPEPDYIYGARPHLFNPDGQENQNFSQYLSTNWTNGWSYDVPDLTPGEYMIVRKLSIDDDPFWAPIFGCGDTTYFTIPDLGPTCGNVSGKVLVDTNEDCVADFSDAAILEMILEFTPGPYYATTNAQGEYSINLPLGNYTVAQQTAVLVEHCLGDPTPLTVVGSMNFDLLDTAIMAQDVQLTMASGPARPGFQLSYAIDVDNLTSANSQLNSLVMTFDANVSYINASPTPSNVSGNTITWNNLGWLYYFGHRDVSVQLQVPPDVGLIGTDLLASATLISNGDANTTNNTATWAVTVTGSYDPNDKIATTSSNLSRDLYFIDQDQWIDYTIRFQNTGTDTAFTVVVTDTLPATLDASTLVVGAGSHPFTWSLQGNGTLKCYFVNILLPDSNVNETASHGFVSFRIMPKQPLLPGTVIENTANIYFDFNTPVITETSVLTAEFSTGMQGQAQGREQVRLLPNPASDRLSVSVADGTIETIAILAADGREVMCRGARASNTTLDVSGLRAGSYFILATLNNGSIVHERFIKH